MANDFLAKQLEAYETPEWAVRSTLDSEILTQQIVDPCAGRGVMGRIFEGGCDG